MYATCHRSRQEAFLTLKKRSGHFRISSRSRFSCQTAKSKLEQALGPGGEG